MSGSAKHFPFSREEQVKKAVEEAIKALPDRQDSPFHARRADHRRRDVPDDLDALVRAYLDEHPEDPWEDAVRHVVKNGDADDED